MTKTQAQSYASDITAPMLPRPDQLTGSYGLGNRAGKKLLVCTFYGLILGRFNASKERLAVRRMMEHSAAWLWELSLTSGGRISKFRALCAYEMTP